MAETPFNLAKQGQYQNMAWAKLTEEDILTSDKDGFTFLHYTAYHGYFDKIPKNLQDEKYWKPSKNNTTVLMSAFERGQFEQDTSPKNTWIKPEHLTEKEILKTNGNGDSILTHAVLSKNLRQIPKDSITARALQSPLSPLSPPSSQENIIHAIIRLHQLKDVPEAMLTEEVLSSKTRNGDTAYHKIATMVNEDYPNIWNQKTITLKDASEVTPMHLLTNHCPWSIPNHLLTKENLRLKDKQGQTVLDYWSREINWRLIPLDIISEDDLLLNKNIKIKSPLDNIISQYKDAIAWGPNTGPSAKEATSFITKLITKLSNQTLIDMKAYAIPQLNKILTSELIKRQLSKNKESSIEI